jgi:hypothetical protein
MQFNVDTGTFLGTGTTDWRIKSVGAAKNLGLTGQVWAGGFEEYAAQGFRGLSGFNLHVFHRTTLEQLDRILAGVERGSFGTTVLGQHLETAASRVGLTMGDSSIEMGSYGEYWVSGAFRRPSLLLGFSRQAVPLAGGLLLSGLANSPVASGDVHVEDGLDQDLDWGIRAVISLVSGHGLPDPPAYVQRQNEANAAEYAARQAEEAKAAIEQEPMRREQERIRQWGLEGAGHSL